MREQQRTDHLFGRLGDGDDLADLSTSTRVRLDQLEMLARENEVRFPLRDEWWSAATPPTSNRPSIHPSIHPFIHPSIHLLHLSIHPALEQGRLGRQGRWYLMTRTGLCKPTKQAIPHALLLRVARW